MNHNLKVGDSITIKRTDGRLQSAIISSIDNSLGCVKVEWLEDGETKGKEVHLSNVLSLNPHVCSTPRNSIIPKYHTPITLHQNSMATNTTKDIYVNKDRRKTATTPNKTHSARSPKSYTNQKRNHRGVNTINNKDTLTDHSMSELVVMANKASYSARTSKSVVENNNSTIIKEPHNTTLRKLNKLEKERAQRRAKQAEIRAEKEQIQRKSQNTPHWQLLKMINEYRNNIDFTPLSPRDVIEDHLITVAVRKRPLNDVELTKKEIDIITVPTRNKLVVHEPKLKVDLTKYLDNHIFKFDYAINEYAPNDVVFKYTAQPLIKTVFQGGFATCFAYGQTGSGKTYTMSGDTRNNNERGIYALTASDIFKLTHSNTYKKHHFVISCSFFEIYVKKVFDLLNKKSVLKILEDGKQQIQIVGLTETVVRSEDEVLDLIKRGNEERASGQTSANSESSRSHAIFQFFLRNPQNMRKIHGKFSLIDLAGNERGADTYSSSKLTRLEGAEINQSLLCLKECIRALGRKGAHLPFRGSKLTQVLKDSFVGNNSKTCMIAMISPGVNSCENTLNTLRYADRVKELGSADMTLNKSDIEVRESSLNNAISNHTHVGKGGNKLGNVSYSFGTQCSLKTLRDEVTMMGDGEGGQIFNNEKLTKNHKELVKKLQESAKEAENLLNDIGKFEYEKYLLEFECLIDDTVTCLLKAKDIL